MSARLKPAERRYFIGGSDARIIMGNEVAGCGRKSAARSGRGPLPESRCAARPFTEELNRRWFNTGEVITDVQRHVRHPTVRWLAATPDGRVQSNGAVFEAKFMLPWYSRPPRNTQLQHNMWVLASRSAVLSVITGGGKWVEIKVHADPLHQHLIILERKFWRCVETGERPRLFDLSRRNPGSRRSGSLT